MLGVDGQPGLHAVGAPFFVDALAQPLLIGKPVQELGVRLCQSGDKGQRGGERALVMEPSGIDVLVVGRDVRTVSAINRRSRAAAVSSASATWWATVRGDQPPSAAVLSRSASRTTARVSSSARAPRR